MAATGPSWTQVHPSQLLPETIVNFNQASGAFETLGGEGPQVRLNDGDLYVYMKTLTIRTRVMTGQTNANQLPSSTISVAPISAPVYKIRTRAEWDRSDESAFNRWGINMVEAQRLGMRQGTFQQLRNLVLVGNNPIAGEGLLNAALAVSTTLPPDSFGNTTASTYDSGQMAVFFLGVFGAMKVRTMQLGMPGRFVVLGSQRTLQTFEWAGIVQLTSFQRPGGGSLTTAGVVKEVTTMNGDKLLWTYDDTLQGRGAGGTDAILIVMPEVEKQEQAEFNTNEFADLTPSMAATCLQLIDRAAPLEITSPLAGGAVDMIGEMSSTPGWAIRPEAVTIISMAP